VRRELRVSKFCLFIAAAALVVASTPLLFPGGNIRTGPKRLLDKGLILPISASEASNDVIAKIEFKDSQTNEIDEILKWYSWRGFNIVPGGLGIHGFGPHGISFVICSTNQAQLLMIKEWKDM
jgi:hypothetical protein